MFWVKSNSVIFLIISVIYTYSIPNFTQSISSHFFLYSPLSYPIFVHSFSDYPLSFIPSHTPLLHLCLFPVIYKLAVNFTPNFFQSISSHFSNLHNYLIYILLKVSIIDRRLDRYFWNWFPTRPEA